MVGNCISEVSMHEELMARDGLYRHLNEVQAQTAARVLDPSSQCLAVWLFAAAFVREPALAVCAR